MIFCLTSGSRQGSQAWTETPETMRQNKPSSYKLLLSGICHTVTESLTSTDHPGTEGGLGRLPRGGDLGIIASNSRQKRSDAHEQKHTSNSINVIRNVSSSNVTIDNAMSTAVVAAPLSGATVSSRLWAKHCAWIVTWCPVRWGLPVVIPSTQIRTLEFREVQVTCLSLQFGLGWDSTQAVGSGARPTYST
jgi:hypothetical protein